MDLAVFVFFCRKSAKKTSKGKDMLLQFSVENYKSIRLKQTFSMAASGYYKENKENNVFSSGLEEDIPELLKTAVIYGPNAAGKSTIIAAMEFMEGMVLHSAKDSQADELIDVVPFRLSRSCAESDSEFEIVIVEGGVRYQFGFRANKDRVTEEWLYAYPNGRMQRWYARVYDPESRQDSYVFGKNFSGGRRRTDWKESTRPNSLFISTAVMLNCEQLKVPYGWFSKRLATLADSHLTDGYTIKQVEKYKEKILEFLSCADITIADLKVNYRKFSSDEIPDVVTGPVRDQIIKELSGKEIPECKFYRNDIESGELIEFDIEDESKGTRELFAFAGPWIDIIENDRVLFVDELDSSLHPLVVHQLVSLFHKHGSKAQLIFTTHDTSILSKGILRRDQIWFVEKDQLQSSNFYPLSDYSVREGEALEKGYLAGRYGGIPFMKDLQLGN